MAVERFGFSALDSIINILHDIFDSANLTSIQHNLNAMWMIAALR